MVYGIYKKYSSVLDFGNPMMAKLLEMDADETNRTKSLFDGLWTNDSLQMGDIGNDFLMAQKFDKYLKIFVPIVLILIVLVGLVGNAMVIIVILTNKTMQRVSNIPIFNLAVADLGFIIVCVPMTALHWATSTWPFGIAGCAIVLYLTEISVYASVYTLVIMSVDRYLAIVYPIASIPYRQRANMVKILVILWLILLIVHVPFLFYAEIISFTFAFKFRTTCTATIFYKEPQASVFLWFSFICSYVLPLTLICVFYSLLLKRILHRECRGHVSSALRNTERQKRSTKIVLCVVVAFALCWLPNHIMILTVHYSNDKFNNIFRVLHVSANCLAYMNSCLNPILYAFVSERFRDAFIQMLRCKCNR